MSRGRKIGLLLGLVLLLGGFGYLLYGGLDKNLVYFLTPTELQAKGAAAYDAPVRLGGQVVPGSVVWNSATLDLRFRMTDGRNVVEVHARKAPPQMFREGMGVVVEGQMRHSGVFDASNLLVKHSNEYRPPSKGHKPEEMYRSLIKDAQS
jgi:cytochrome c-type biogenesis protein CcmE